MPSNPDDRLADVYAGADRLRRRRRAWAGGGLAAEVVLLGAGALMALPDGGDEAQPVTAGSP